MPSADRSRLELLVILPPAFSDCAGIPEAPGRRKPDMVPIRVPVLVPSQTIDVGRLDLGLLDLGPLSAGLAQGNELRLTRLCCEDKNSIKAMLR